MILKIYNFLRWLLHQNGKRFDKSDLTKKCKTVFPTFSLIAPQIVRFNLNEINAATLRLKNLPANFFITSERNN